MSGDWRSAFENLDVEVLAAQTLAVGATWPAIALALVMIDERLIDRGKLLDVIDALHSLESAWSTDELGDADDAVLGLDRMRDILSALDVPPGMLTAALRQGVAAKALQALARRPRPT